LSALLDITKLRQQIVRIENIFELSSIVHIFKRESILSLEVIQINTRRTDMLLHSGTAP